MVTCRSAALWLAIMVAACERAPELSWHEEGVVRWRTLKVPSRGRPGFQPLSGSATGISHRNLVADERARANRHLLIGAGAATGDIDEDGLPDLFLASVEQPAALYRNRGGFRFEDVTASSGIDTRGLASMSAAFADVNGDAHLDLIVGTLGGPLKLWFGDGAGHFADSTSSSGLLAGFAATAITFADVEGDGDLDLYVGTYKTRNALDAFTPQQRAFDQVVKKVGSGYRVVDAWASEYRIEENLVLGGIMRSQRAEPDLFFLNDGHGRFTRIAMAGPRFRDEAGRPLRTDPDYFTLAARFYDVNDDGAPDLYVCNDFEDPDQFWLNDGQGNFRLVDALALRETSNTCMSVDFADINRDGHVDFFTADMMSPTLEQRQRQFPTHMPLPKRPGLAPERHQWMRNMLQLARGDGTWASIGDFAGVSATDWTWGSAFIDVDLDGFEDLVAVNGHRWDVRDADTFERIRNSFPRVEWNKEQGEFPPSATRSFAFRNNGDLTFRDMSREWEIGAEPAISQGIALVDFDGDGDLDVIATRLNDTPVIYRNRATAPRIAVRLVGDGSNRQGIGAKVTVRAPSLPAQTREMTAGGYYLSGSEALLSFATQSDTIVTIEVEWRAGRRTVVQNAHANRLYELRESSAQPPPPNPRETMEALFEDATSLLGGHAHLDSTFDDYRRQPLLPSQLSQLGPGVTWFDYDGDGATDLIVGAGRGGRLAVLRNGRRSGVGAGNGSVAVAPFSLLQLGTPALGDLTTVLPVPSSRGGASLVAGQTNYEARSVAEALSIPRVVGFDPRSPRATSTIFPGDSASVGPLALADVNGDGRLDLFVGARVVPGAWPLPAPSRLYLRAADGSWALDSTNAAVLARLGLVSAALFTDLDGDGQPELVTTAEWGPVRVFRNDRGTLRDITKELGLSGITSRWNGLNAGDFDGDGRLDLVVTSWGRNTPWQATSDRPHVLIAGDFGGAGLGLVFTRRDSVTKKEMPLEALTKVNLAVPSAPKRFATFTEYARASVGELLGDRAQGAVRVGATTFDHLVLMNRGGTFEQRPLPAIAQLAPAFAPVVADFNGDGREDLFLSQNFSATENETPRFDAGAGLVLLGAGDGTFKPLSVRESGIRVLGDQRGAAVADYDGDGRVDLAVSQNAERTTLWRNRNGRQGIRARLQGPPENPFGIGSRLRLIAGNKSGPVREIRAGGGYWSVDDPVAVLARPEGATAVVVRWPDGSEGTFPLPIGQIEIRLRHP